MTTAKSPTAYAAELAAAKRDPDTDVTNLRKEVQQLPSYKNISQAAPIYRSMAETAGRNTKASDLNLVYGLGKIMDSTSVVREGEMIMVKNSAGMSEQGLRADIDREIGNRANDLEALKKVIKGRATGIARSLHARRNQPRRAKG